MTTKMEKNHVLLLLQQLLLQSVEGYVLAQAAKEPWQEIGQTELQLQRQLQLR